MDSSLCADRDYSDQNNDNDNIVNQIIEMKENQNESQVHSENNVTGPQKNKKDLSGPALDCGIPRGNWKSGRFWKAPKDRFRSINQVKALRLPLSKKQKQRQERKALLALTNSIKEEKKKKKEELRERQNENKKRKLENERKAEVVQVITNTRKLKKLNKRQFKSIETRDTSAMV